MKRFFIVFALLSLSPQVLLAANAATWVHIDGYGRVYGRAHGTGDHVHSRCWAGPGNGRCVTLSIDDSGNVAYSSSTAIKQDDEVHTATFNQAIDSRGRSSMNMSSVPVRITDAGAGTVGLAQAGSGVPVTYARTSDENPLAPRTLLPSASPVAPVGHSAPTREGRKNYPVGNQTPRPFAPSGYFRY
jgi:hypothetical protein